METNNMQSNVDIKSMTKEQRAALLAELQRQEKDDRIARRDAYEGLRADFMRDVWAMLQPVTDDVRAFRQKLEDECRSFREVMREYGQLRKGEDQGGFTIVHGDMKLEVRMNKVKGFDERADMAAERLIDYLRRYMEASEKGADDPMYQMALTLLERNKMGDLDYKSISKLYELEDKFDAEYADIMRLFKEANVVQRNATNYYFYRRNPDNGVWTRIEPSFCRL